MHVACCLADNRCIGNPWHDWWGGLMSVYFDFASRGKNDWWRYPLCLVAASLLAILGLAISGIVLVVLRLLPSDFAAQMQQPKNIWPFFLGIAATFGAMTAGLMVAAVLIHRKRPADMMGRWRWGYFAWGLGIWMVVQAALAIIDALIAPHGFHLSAAGGTAGLAVSALVGIPLQTFAEEFIFRGYLTQGLLLAFKKPLPAAIASGLLFGSVHIANGGSQTINAVMFGIVCALIAIRTGGIALTWGLHLANNYFGAVFVVSGNDVFEGSPGIFTQNTPQLIWWDLFLAVAALLATLWLIFRRPYFAAEPDG
jgi:membrane protease YdiL (CAAX protease family)